MGYVCDIPIANYAYNLNAAQQGVPLSLLQEGTGLNNRVGRLVRANCVHIKGSIFSGAGAAEETLRSLVVWDHQPNGTAAAWSDVIQATDYQGANTNGALDGVNASNVNRFTVLYDRVTTAPSTAAATGATLFPQPTAEELTFDEELDLEELTSVYNKTANPPTVASVSTGILYFISQGTVGGQFSAKLAFRFEYSDAMEQMMD